VEPFTSFMLEAFVHTGVEQAREWVAKKEPPAIGQPADQLLSGVSARFQSPDGVKPAFVMVGLCRDDTWRKSLLVKYGDVLRIRVPRGLYQVTGWFFANDNGAGGPVLVAVGQSAITIIGNRPEKFVLRGHVPDQAELEAILESHSHSNLPFALPASVQRRGPGTVAPRIPEPSLEMTSSPLCPVIDANGKPCALPLEFGSASCPNHSAGDPSRFQILTWSGAPENSLFYHTNFKSGH
jgi:hypothetical protein